MLREDDFEIVRRGKSRFGKMATKQSGEDREQKWMTTEDFPLLLGRTKEG